MVRPPSMVERKVWGSKLRRFLAASTGVMIGSLSTAQGCPRTPVFGEHLFYSQPALSATIFWLGCENGIGWLALGPDLTAAADVLLKAPLRNHRCRRRREFQTSTGHELPCIAPNLTGSRHTRGFQRHYALATASRLRCRYRFTRAKLAHSR